jgi:hypothetical protein
MTPAKLGVRMVRYSFPVPPFHRRLHAGLSRRTPILRSGHISIAKENRIRPNSFTRNSLLLNRSHDLPAIHRPFLAYPGTAPGEVPLLMCHTVCFEAGRFTQTQSSWTALRCSRKWMSGPAAAPAAAWAEFVTDRSRHIVAQFVGPTTALQETLPSAGRSLFFVDKSLSWTSPGIGDICVWLMGGGKAARCGGRRGFRSRCGRWILRRLRACRCNGCPCGLPPCIPRAAVA